MSQLEIEIETPVGKKTVHLDPFRDVELGENESRVYWNKIVSYRIFAHIIRIDKHHNTEVFYIHYRYINGDITEYIRIIRKETVINILSRIRNVKENAASAIIPYFETEKEKVQLFDRVHDYDGVLTDKEILQELNKVQSFHFFGHHVVCHRNFPHPPHITGYYNTVRYGPLPIYCTGKSGVLKLSNGKKVQLIISKACPEDCYGHYLFFELLEE